jgi:hypothetical protein
MHYKMDDDPLSGKPKTLADTAPRSFVLMRGALSAVAFGLPLNGH